MTSAPRAPAGQRPIPRNSGACAHHRPGRWWVTIALVCSGVLGALGCDQSIEIENQAPTAELVGWCTDLERTYLVIDVVDLEGDPVDLAVCGRGGAAVATGSAGDGFDGLSSEPDAPGRRHRVQWANRPDGSPCPCPRAGGGDGSECLRPPTGDDAPSLELLAGDPDHPLDAAASLVGLMEVAATPLGPCP